MKINEAFSQNLVRIRKLRGLTQQDLASRTGLSSRMINYYEKGPKAVPMEKLELLAKALNTKIADFFSENETNPLDDLDVRWVKKMLEIKNLPEADRKEINKHINSLIEKAELRKQSNKVSGD